MNFSKQLLTWIKEGENERLKIMLEKSHYYHSVDTSKIGLLHYAASYGNQEITHYLLNKGCDVNVQDASGTTPLMLAIREKHEEIIKILLTAEADILIVNKENKSALDMFCAEHELTFRVREIFLQKLKKKCVSNKDCAERLVNAGCFLYQAIHLNSVKIIKHMLRFGYSVNDIHPIDKTSVLHLAVAYENVECMKLLAENGVDATLEDIEGKTPLFYLYGCIPGHTDEKIQILKILLNLGISPTSCTSDGLFQIQPTLMIGNKEAIRVVLQANIDFTAKNSIYERYALHYLAMNTNPGIVEELILYCKEFDVNVLDKYGTSPLYWAAKYANVDMLVFLLKEGAEVNIAHSECNFTPLYNACVQTNPNLESQYYKCAEFLLQHDADPQCIIINDNGEKITIFEAAPIVSNLDTLKSVIAYLAVFEELGKSVSEIIQTKISTYRPLNKYLKRCKRLLRQKMSGNVTLFKLLTSKKNKIAKYLNNEELVLKMRRINCNSKVKLSYRYYFNTFEKLYLESVRYRGLKKTAAQIICNIFEGKLDKENLIINKIIDYLNQQSLERLSQL